MLLLFFNLASHTNANSDIPLVITAFLFWKFFKKTKFVNLADVPLRTALEQSDKTLDEEL